MTGPAVLGAQPVPACPGELYMVETAILGPDPKPRRPALVVLVPSLPSGRLTVVTRTSDLNEPGVHHDADPSLALTVPGVFSHVRTAEVLLWTTEYVEYRGPVPTSILEEVLEEFGL